MRSRVRAWAALALVLIALCGGTAFGARPLLDQHQWDAYFAMYARDVYVPWKPTAVRLDTYSGAPVDFSVYNVDPADVIIAGQNRTPRALDTAHRKALSHWRFSPPAGYRFQSSDVEVPLGSQEGFYVVEARRGDAVQQVWINRTHIGLVTKESPEGLVLWGVDLRSGRAIAHMNVEFLVGLDLITKATDRDGLIVLRGRPRPSFALASDGAARAFLSILPQAPAPPAVLGIRVESAVVRAGERVRFVGFARRRTSGPFKRASGDARVVLAGHGTILTTAFVHLDQAGAFSGELAIPPQVDAGDYALLGNASGAVGGTTVHVDAAGDVTLAIRSLCPCDPDRDVPFQVVAQRGGAPAPGVSVNVEVVRSPHVVAPGAPDDAARWGTTVVYTHSVRTDANGVAPVSIPSTTDGLDSTYGVRAAMHGASATTRIVVPNGRLALALEPDALQVDVGSPIGFWLRGFDAIDGTPIPAVSVDVKLSHGASEQAQTVTLDARGTARVTFKQSSLGANLAIAQATYLGRSAMDAADVVVEPSALSGRGGGSSGTVAVSVDRPRYHVGDNVVVRANEEGASGDALITLDGLRTYASRRVGVDGGNAYATLPFADPQGAVRIGAAFVRDGAIGTAAADVAVDDPGHPRLTDVALDRTSYAPGETAHASIRDGELRGASTLAVRIADGRESGAALFEDAPGLLASGATQTQASASDDPEWHAYVQPKGSKANDIFAAERARTVGTEVPTIGAAAARTLYWRVARQDGETFDVPVPRERGHYVLSVLKIADDGDVGAASVAFNVQ